MRQLTESEIQRVGVAAEAVFRKVQGSGLPSADFWTEVGRGAVEKVRAIIEMPEPRDGA